MERAVSCPSREDRRHRPDDRCDSGRCVAERDRDRILYTSALRRLAGVTQVVAPEEGHVVHNRLTHVLEVAQITRRLAEKLRRDFPKEVDAIGGLDPNVAEAAALAHDLGHPPFGHVAEEELDRLLYEEGVAEGYEGNAQSFRIITKLAVRREDTDGLDLSRATLAATLKYPWKRDTDLSSKKNKKFGYYASEAEDFDFARKLMPAHSDHQSVEARIMDLADDIAYSVSDLEDFVRAGRIPFDALAMSSLHAGVAKPAKDPKPQEFESEERQNFLAAATVEICKKHGQVSTDELRIAFNRLLGMLPIGRQYDGTKSDRARLRRITGGLMGVYISDARLDASANDRGYVVISRQTELEIALLKQLTWHYVINSPALASQQEGQKEIVRGLFGCFCCAAKTQKNSHIRFFPRRLGERIDGRLNDYRYVVRCIADFVASMSDNEAVDLYQRLHGMSQKRPIGAVRL